MRLFLLFVTLFLTAQAPVFAQQTAWEEEDSYINGFARVFHQNKFSYINDKQKLISPFVFEDARNFYDHLAAVKQNNKWGFINEQGQTVIPFEYDIVFDFAQHVTVVSRSGRWWLADAGHFVKELDISVCYGFQNGSAIVYRKGQKGTMDLKGNIVFERAVNNPAQSPISYPGNESLVSCPANLNFESGNFTNWSCFTGFVDSVGNTNVITVVPSPPTAGRHTIYAKTTPSAVDGYGLFPINPPDGSTYAVKLGNTQVNAQAERIRYVIHVPLNDSNFSFRYHYAVVFQDPGHTPWTQPRFSAKVFDSAANSYINCASFEYISTSNLPGFIRSTVDASVMYKAWSPVFISLRGYAGKTMYLEFTTADCVRKAHWGYAYVDVENLCGQSVQFQYQCDTPHVTTLTAPPGFQTYKWWNQNYSVLLGTGQNVTLNPGPPPNSLIWLQMIPFLNFGCEDTIPVRLTGTAPAHFDPSDTLGVCAPHNFTFYNRYLPSTLATWNFGDGTTGIGDTVNHTYALPGTYIIRLNVTGAAGCGEAVDTVRVVQPSGSFTYTGGSFCNSKQVVFTATTQYIDSLFWTFGDGTFLNTTQTTVTHTYSQPGIYYPQLRIKSNGGCQLILPGIDSIRIEKLVPGYSNNILQTCGSSTVSLTDTSHAYFGIASRVWDFGDGTTGSGISVTHTYTITGTYAIKLVVTGVTGCKDSVIKNIYVKVNNKPVASIAGETNRCMNSSLTFTSTVDSDDPVNILNWSCSNGTTGTGNSFTVNFNSTGTFTITLIAGTIYGCYDTVTHTVNINPLPTAAVSGAATVCLGAPSPVITFTGAGSVAPYTFTYTINGGANQTITTGSGNSVTIAVPTNVAGTFTYTLLSVQDGSATSCSQLQNGIAVVTINPLPTASITGNAAVCLNAPSPLVTFTGGGSVGPYTFTYTINGGANQNISTTIGNTVTIAVPTTATRSFVYTLISVVDGSSTHCSQLQTGIVSIMVNPLPTASISGNTAVCLNTASPLVTFTGAGSTAPYTFTYKINGGPNQTITTTVGNTVTIAAPTNVAGTFIYTLVSVTDASSTNCSQLQNGAVTVIVNPLPTASITGNAAVCLNAPSPSVIFTGGSGTAPYTFTYTVNGGANQTITTTSGNSVTINVPTNSVGTFVYTLISVQDGSSTACSQLQAGTVTVTVNPLPAASINGAAQVCVNASPPLITFTGSGSTAPYTFTYNINGGANQTITTTTGNSVTIAAPTSTAGTFVYNLLSVQDASSTACSQLQPGSAIVKVNPLPTASITGSTIVCLTAPAPLVTFTGAGSTAPYTFTYNINGGANQIITTTSGNSITIPVSTSTAGTFVYNLVSVQDASTTACSQLQPGTVTITVNPSPSAVLNGPAPVCLNAPSPLVTFTGAGGTAPYTFTYTINGGPNQTITTISGNSVSVAAPTNIAGTFVYTLTSVQDGSSTSCSQFQNGIITVTVNPLPTASIIGNTTVCLNAPTPMVTFTGAGSVSPYTFTYNINGGSNQTITTTVGNSVTVAVPTNIAGTFIYNLISVQDGSSTSCSQLQPANVSITVNPLPTASISGNTAVCLNAQSPVITFTGGGSTAPYTFTYNINGGANQIITTTVGNSTTIAAPTNIAGTFIYTLVSVQDGSTTACRQLQPGAITVTVNPLPTASISGNIAVCLNAPSPVITFTGAGSVSPYRFTYNINGGSNQTITTTTGNSVTIAAPTTTTGTFVYTLVSVQDGSATACSQLQPGSVTITVNPLPIASITGNTAVCLNAASPLVTFTGSGSTAPYTFTYNINGGPNQTITTASGNSVTIAAPTTTAGVFTYNLVSVQDGSALSCNQLQTGAVTITVNPLPTASLAGNTAVCLNAPSPLVTFTGAGSVAPYTFTYNINGGPNQTITTTVGNSVTIAAPTTIAGTFTYNLVSVQDGSSTICSQLQSGAVSITVNPLPAASVSGNTAVCLSAPSPLVTFTGSGSVAPYTFTYNINGGPNQTISTTVGNSVTIAVPTTTAGIFIYTLISVQDGSSTTCSQLQSGTATITVNPLPTASISGNTAVCLNAPSPVITFTGAGSMAPYTFTYNINGGSNQTVTTTVGNSVSVAVPTSTVGTFTYTLISVQDGSSTLCSQLQTGSVTVTVNPLPTASVSGNTVICMNGPSPLVTFTGAGSTAPYTFTYSVNGGPDQTVTTSGGNTATVVVPTNAAGTFNYTLVSVQDGSSTSCSQLQSGVVTIVINPLPAASITGNTTVCLNAPSPVITFTGAGSTAPYTFTYNINGGSNQTITTTSGNSVTIAAPTNVAGTFTYTLVSVQDGSSTACSQLQNGNVVIIVNPLPTASIAGNTTICLNAPSPLITFTGAGSTAPYTFTYNINGGSNQTITTTSGNSVTLAVPTSVAGTFTYTLLSVQDGSSTTCSQLQTGIVTIIINPLPTASITGSTAVCLNGPSPLITFTGGGSTAPYTFIYNINGGANQTITTSSGNSVTIIAPTTTAGTFVYTLIAVQDGSSTTCGQLQSGLVVIAVNPLPTASINGNTAICLNAPSPLVTFTGAGSTAPYTFTYNINGGPNQTITTISGNTVTLPVPTNVPGTFVYTLISVQDGSSTTCNQLQSGTATITVNEVPTAAISGPATVCLNAASPMVTFTGAGGSGPYTFTYMINGGPNQTVTTTSGSSVSVAASTSTAGIFNYTLISVQDNSSTTCHQLQSGTVSIVVNPLPMAAISGGSSVCINAASPSVTFSGSGSTAPYTFTYNLNGGPAQTITTTTGNSVSIPVPTNITGTFTYTIVSVQDASSTACINTLNVSTVVYVRPLPQVFAGNDPELCRGRSLQLNATGAAQYTWSPAAGLSCTNCSSPRANPVTDMQYVVQGTSSFGCVNTDTVMVKVIQPFVMLQSPDDTICAGKFVQMNASGANSYVWSPATGLNKTDIANPVASPSSTTTYQVLGFDGHGCFTDTGYIKINVGPIPIVNAGADLNLSNGTVVVLNPTVQNGPIVSWLWEPATDLSCSNCPYPKLTVHNNASYKLTVTTQYGCIASDVINISTFCKTSNIFIPNAFTPDGDGTNDILMVRGKGIHVKYFRIFSRWGEMIFEKKDFEPNDPKYGWDGRVRGVLASPDVFVYVVEVVCDINVAYTLKGNTSLLK